MSPRFHRRLTVWAALCLLTVVLLTGFCFLDTAFAGHSVSEADPFPYEHADSVRYGLGGLRYFYRGHLLTGPHLSYPLVLAALALNLGALWLVRGWGQRVRRMFKVNALALMLTLGLGWPTVLLAQKAHNDLLARHEWSSVSASPLVLSARACVDDKRDGPCQATRQLNLPNPAAWGLVGLALTGLAGLRRDRQVLKTATASLG